MCCAAQREAYIFPFIVNSILMFKFDSVVGGIFYGNKILLKISFYRKKSHNSPFTAWIHTSDQFKNIFSVFHICESNMWCEFAPILYNFALFNLKCLLYVYLAFCIVCCTMSSLSLFCHRECQLIFCVYMSHEIEPFLLWYYVDVIIVRCWLPFVAGVCAQFIQHNLTID